MPKMKEVDRFLTEFESVNTRRSYQKSIEMFKEHFNIRVVTDIALLGKSDILKFRMSLLECGNTATTANNRIRCVNSFVNWLVENEFIKNNPLNGLKALKEPKKLPVFLSTEEQEEIYAACETIAEKMLIKLFLTTGIRRAEACALKVTDIRDGYIYISGKGNKERTLPVHPELQALLKEYLIDYKNTYLLSSKLGDGVSSETIRNRLKAILRKTKIDPKRIDQIAPHTLRHTVGTNLTRKGIPTVTVQSILGHSSIITTQRYAHVDDRAKKDAVSVL